MEHFAIPCVGAIIEREINGETHILLQRRQKPDGGEDNGKLELPGGKIQAYENVFAALRREIREETGLTLKTIHGERFPLDTAKHSLLSFSPYYTTQNLSGAYSIIIHFFRCEAEGEPFPSSDESTDIRWIPLREVRPLFLQDPEQFFFLQHTVLRHYLALE